MSKIRTLLGVTLAVAMLAGLAARADTTQNDKSKVIVEDSATRQAQLKRSYEQFRSKLLVLAGRLEASSDAKDRDKAKALRAALKEASTRNVEAKFESLIQALSKKGADKNIDVLAQVIRENDDLRKDLRTLIALLTQDDRDKILIQKREDAKKLLDQLKELRDKQARHQALTELAKKDAKDLKTAQEKLTERTKELLEDLDKKDAKDTREAEEEKQKLADAARKPVTEANEEQKKSESKLGKGDTNGAGMSQGNAVSKLDEAIRNVEEILRQTRKEEQERKLLDLLERAKKMLKVELEIQSGSEKVSSDLRQEKDGKPGVQLAARINKIGEAQLDNLREAEAALKVIRTEGSAAAFEEVFDQLSKDMDLIHTRLNRIEVDKITLTIVGDTIETLKDIIKALEKAIKENEENNNPRPPRDGPSGKPKLVSRLQQLKMIFALQRRVNSRTELYGKRYTGEQVPQWKDEREKARYETIGKELKDLSGRQEKIAKVTKEIGKEAESGSQ